MATTTQSFFVWCDKIKINANKHGTVQWSNSFYILKMSAQKYFGLAGLYTFRSKTWQVRWNCIILVVVLFRETRTHIWTAMPQNMHPSTKCNKCFDCQNRGYILFCKSNECKKYFICRQKFNITIYLTDLFIYKTSLHLYVYGWC